MKRLLFSFVFTAAFAVVSFAQSAPPALDQATPVSHAAYVAKVNELNTAIAAHNSVAAETLFGEVNQMVNDEMKVVRYKMRDATSAAERTKYVDLTKTQRGLFSNVMNMKQSGSMTENRVQLIEALNAFGATIE
jgi:hypothetical protein